MPNCTQCDPERDFFNGRALAMHVRQKHPAPATEATEPEVSPHKSSANPLERLSKEDLLALVKELTARPEEAAIITPTEPFQPKYEAKEPLMVDLKDREEAAAMQRSLPGTLPLEPGSQPGEYKVVGRDKSGNESYLKVQRTKKYLEEKYPMVTFEPNYPRRVTVWGVRYDLVPRKENTVPNIIRDIYYSWLENLERENKRYPMLSSDEERNITQGALEGGMAWSRVFKTGAGWSPAEDESHGPAAPATQQ